MTARRQVLVGLVSALVALTGFRRPAAATAPRTLGQRLAGVFSHAESATRIGRAVARAGVAQGTSRQVLERRLAGACEPAWRVAGAEDKVLRDAIRKIVTEDFAAERTVAVGGWRLAEAEAAIYRVIAEDSVVLS